jgi:hypothetical protein
MFLDLDLPNMVANGIDSLLSRSFARKHLTKTHAASSGCRFSFVISGTEAIDGRVEICPRGNHNADRVISLGGRAPFHGLSLGTSYILLEWAAIVLQKGFVSHCEGRPSKHEVALE